MTPSKNCLDLIKSQEGCILHPYLDQAKVPTIGWGTVRYSNGRHVTMQDPPINQASADRFLENEADETARAVSAMIPAGLSQNQFDALVDFAYNAGTGALSGSTLLKLIKANPTDPAIRAAFMMWDKIHVDGRLEVCDDLVKRRKKEADLYFKG
jgi:lysozyme